MQALAPGTNVGALLDGGGVRYGRVHEVTGGALTLWERSGRNVLTRSRIERLALREPSGQRKWLNVVRGAVIGLAVVAVPVYIATTIDEHGSGRGSEFGLLLLGPAIGAALGSTRPPEQTFRDQVIYVRP